MRFLFLVVAFLLASSSAAFAQTTTQFLWTHEGVPPVVANTYRFTVLVDNVPVTGLGGQPVSCTGQGANSICAVTVPAHVSGSKTYVVRAELNGVEVGTTRTINADQGPVTPSNPRLQINVTVTVTQG